MADSARRRLRRAGVVEFAVADAIEEAVPLVAIEDQDPVVRITGHPHQDPLAALPRHPGTARRPAQWERHLDVAVALPRALPLQRAEVDAQLGRGRLGAPRVTPLRLHGLHPGHGILATPLYIQRDPSLS